MAAVSRWRCECCQGSLTQCIWATLGTKVGRRGTGYVVTLTVPATVIAR